MSEVGQALGEVHMKKLIVFLGSCLLAGLFVFGNQMNHQVQAAEKTYEIGTDVTYPPFEFADEKNQYVGIDIDIMKAIAKSEGFKVKIKPLGFNAAVQAVQSEQIDGVIAGMTITPERQAKFDFADPYYQTGVVMAVQKKSKIKSLEGLRGKRVAIKTGTSAGAYATAKAKEYGFTTVTFDDSDNMYNDVVNGNSAACFEDEPVMQYGIKNGLKLKIVTDPVEGGEYGFAVKKGSNPELIAKFNSGLAKLKANGQYDKIKAKYLSANTPKKTSVDHSFLGLLKENKAALLSGLGQTLLLTVIAIFFATIFGVVFGLLGVLPNRLARGVSDTVVYIFRGLPLLVLALFIYTGIPSLTGQKIPAMVAGVITLMFNEGAYTAAFVKGGIGAVSSGQMEAARSLGLPYGKAMRRVVLPQGIRIMIPSFINQFIITLKDTSILSIIGILELTQTGKIIIARNLEGFKIWAMIALIYLIVITLLTWLSKYIEGRINN